MTKSKSSAPERPSAAIAGTAEAASGITPAQLEHMIAEAAYYRAEHRGFQSGDPQQDWLEAEVEIKRMLETMH